MSQELEQLAERQIEQQAELDVKQAEAMLTLEKDLKSEEQAGGQQVTDQIEEQKLKVDITKKLSCYRRSITYSVVCFLFISIT